MGVWARRVCGFIKLLAGGVDSVSFSEIVPSGCSWMVKESNPMRPGALKARGRYSAYDYSKGKTSYRTKVRGWVAHETVRDFLRIFTTSWELRVERAVLGKKSSSRHISVTSASSLINSSTFVRIVRSPLYRDCQISGYCHA